MSTPNPSSGSARGYGDGEALANARGPAGATALAVALPFAVYLWTASGTSYWLDAGEFVAAAVNLDIAHPPGHPLSALYGKLWTLLPFGPLPFRVSLGQAAAAALAAGFMFRAALTGARTLGARDAVAVPAALAAAWLPALTFAVWFQGVRAEVYALAGLLGAAALERLVQVQSSNSPDPRPLYAAAFAVGLGLANHHVMAFSLFPALLWCAWTVARRRRSARPVAACALLGLLALGAYAYLPVRAAREPPANFGVPVTLERMYWVVSARVYAREIGSESPQPLGERFADLGVLLVENLHAVTLLAALLGLYAAWRLQGSRRVAWLLVLTALCALGVRPWIGPLRGNPDALGYMFSGFGALGVLAGLAAAALGALAGRGRRSPLIAALLWAVALLGAAAQIGRHGLAADLSAFRATDGFDEHRGRRLPPRAVLIATTPQTVFRQLDLSASEALRPDVALVPVPFLRYPGVADAVARAHPGARELVDDFLATDRLRAEPLLRLAEHRPVLVELEAHVSTAAYRALVPFGLLYLTVDPRAAPALLPRALEHQRRAFERLAADLGEGAAEYETSRQLLWLRYLDAVYHAGEGRFEAARAALDAAAALHARDAHVRALRAALQAPRAPLDVRPFLAFDAP